MTLSTSATFKFNPLIDAMLNKHSVKLAQQNNYNFHIHWNNYCLLNDVTLGHRTDYAQR